MAETDFPDVSTSAQEMAPREALLKAVLEFNNSRVRAFFGGEVLEALKLAVGQEATQEEIKRALLAHDANTPSALMQACSIGNLEAVEILLENGAPVDSLSPGGNTPLFYASRTGRSKIVSLLVDKGALKNVRNVKGETSLLFASAGASESPNPGSDPADFTATILFLLSHGLSVRDANLNGLNSLHASSDNPSILSLFIDHYSSSDSLQAELTEALAQKTTLGETPLHLAALSGNFKSTQLLLNLSADPLVTNKAGKTPKQCTKDPAVLSLLKHAESTASQKYYAKQDALLQELASEPTSSTTKTKASAPKKSKKTPAKEPKQAAKEEDEKEEDVTIPASVTTPKHQQQPTPTHAPAQKKTAQQQSSPKPKETMAAKPTKRTDTPVSSQPTAKKSTSSPSNVAKMASQDHSASAVASETTSPVQASDASSWASMVTKKSDSPATVEKVAFKMERSEKTTRTAEEVAAAQDGVSTTSEESNKKKAMEKAQASLNAGQAVQEEKEISVSSSQRPIDVRPPGMADSIGDDDSSSSGGALQERVNALHISSEALELKVDHLLGLHLSDLSMEQLNALADIHRNALACIEEAKLDVTRRQERAYFEEELERRVDTLKRLIARDYPNSGVGKE